MELVSSPGARNIKNTRGVLMESISVEIRRKFNRFPKPFSSRDCGVLEYLFKYLSSQIYYGPLYRRFTGLTVGVRYLLLILRSLDEKY